MPHQVRTTRNGGVLEVAMNRPPVNAIDLAFSRELHSAFKCFNEDPDLRVAILYSDPNQKNIFCAGWDLKAFAAGEGRDGEDGFDLGPGGLGGLPEFFDLYKPVIAAVRGGAIGGGFELALGADLIVASEDAYFWLPEMQRGFLPDAGAIQKLHHRVPYNVAMDLILTGRKMDAREAKHWGMVRDVVPAADLLDHARDVAGTIAQGAPLVATALKEFMRFTAYGSPEQAHATTRKAWVGKSGLVHYERMLASDDFDEGSIAFAEKREPTFKG